MINEFANQILTCLAIAISLRLLSPTRLSAGVLAVVLAGCVGLISVHHHERINGTWDNVKQSSVNLAVKYGVLPTNKVWPPVLGESYTDLELTDLEGRLTSLSDYRGKVILVEPIGMSCSGCVAFAGGHQYGPFADVMPQRNIESIKAYAEKYGQFDLDDPQIILVHLLLYNRQMQPPTSEDARRWAKHFDLQSSENKLVLVGRSSMLGPATRAMIPGFHLIDKNFVFQADSSGHQPTDNLYTGLLPLVGKLLDD